MMFSQDTPAKVAQEEFYKHDKQEAESWADHEELAGIKRRQFVIRYLACPERLVMMKSDKELNLTDGEYQFARKCACELEKKRWEEIFDMSDPEDVKGFQEHLSELGFSDLADKI